MLKPLVRGWFVTAPVFATALVLAIACSRSWGDEPQVKTLEVGGEVKNGFTPLHFAAMHGDSKAVTRLLESGVGANPRQTTFQGTPLQYAAAQGHVEVVKILLKHEATVDAVDSNGRTPLMWAAMQGKTEVVKLLLDADANIGAGNDGGWTPLHYAMSYNHEETTKLLLERGASKELFNRQGKTPLDVKGTNVASE